MVAHLGTPSPSVRPISIPLAGQSYSPLTTLPIDRHLCPSVSLVYKYAYLPKPPFGVTQRKMWRASKTFHVGRRQEATHK